MLDVLLLLLLVTSSCYVIVLYLTFKLVYA